MANVQILEYLRAQGQSRDVEIAAALGLDLAAVRGDLDQIAAQGKIFCCRVTRFEAGRPIEEIQCRISGYIPKAAPGPKPKR